MRVRVRRTRVAGMAIRTSARPSVVTALLLATNPSLAGLLDEPSNVRLCQPRHASYCSCARTPSVLKSTNVTGAASDIGLLPPSRPTPRSGRPLGKGLAGASFLPSSNLPLLPLATWTPDPAPPRASPQVIPQESAAAGQSAAKSGILGIFAGF